MRDATGNMWASRTIINLLEGDNAVRWEALLRILI